MAKIKVTLIECDEELYAIQNTNLADELGQGRMLRNQTGRLGVSSATCPEIQTLTLFLNGSRENLQYTFAYGYSDQIHELVKLANSIDL